ncbi:MAG: adenylate/guanylate cyclase domain-containing protein [Cyanobacteria bacterium J06627_8]
MLGFRSLSIKSKIQLMLLLVSLVSIVSISFLGWSWARAELKHNIFDHLTSVRASKAYQVESYFKTLKNHVETLCEDRMVVSAMQEFDLAYDQLNQTLIPTDWDNAIRDYYREEFFPRLTERVNGTPNYETYAPRGAAARYLQYHYVANNPYPVGEKDALTDAGDGSVYSALHSRYHQLFQHLIQQFGYYDFFLIDPKQGDIIYSVYKETDYGTNLEQGPYSRSSFADVVTAVQDNPDRGAIQIADFKAYKPSYAAPAAFMAGPIYDGTHFIGILAVQMPVNEINRVLTGNQHWQRDGLGDSGETYLVGQDYLMRSISRFLIEDKENYENALRSIGTPNRTIQLIDQLDTSILLQRVRTDAAKRAIAGQEGTQITEDYRGIPVLSSYAPLQLPGLEWIILSEMDLAEAYQPVYSLQTYLLISTVILVIVITFIAGITASNFVKPIDTLIEASRKAELGQDETDVVLKSADEFSELATIFNTVVRGMRQQIHRAEQKYQQTEQILQRLLPDTVSERIKRNDAMLSTQVQQVTVLFATVVGLGQLAETRSVSEMSQLLNKLLSSFNEAAHRSDVEPFKFASDRYIAACGLTKPRLDHEKRMVDLALSLLERVQGFNSTHRTRLSVRIGIHTGTVMTGMLGTRQFSYDIWGLPVAIASALVNSAEANSIVTTSTVRDRLNDLYDFSRGEAIAFEDHAKIETWILKKGALTDLIGELTSGLSLDSQPDVALVPLSSEMTETDGNGSSQQADNRSQSRASAQADTISPDNAVSSSNVQFSSDRPPSKGAIHDLVQELNLEEFD